MDCFQDLLFIEMLAKSGYNKLSDLVEVKEKQFGDIYYDRIDLIYPKPDRMKFFPSFMLVVLLKSLTSKSKRSANIIAAENIVNGIKFYLEGNNRWLLLRSSETEPMIRVYAEGNSNDEVADLLKFGEHLIGHN